MRSVLGPVEIAAGGPLEAVRAVSALPAPRGTTREELEAAALAALLRPPCVVSFSGGRDSSAVLAVALGVARREGLPEPVAVSLRFPGVPSTEESRWQRLVVEVLGVQEHVVVTLTDELDHLGPLATSVALQHGLLWPHNLHLHVPVLDVARGGSLLTGLDGDGLLGGWRTRGPADVAAGRRRPRLGDARPRWSRRYPLPGWLDWLDADAAELVRADRAATARSEPRTWPARVAWALSRRAPALAEHGLAVLAADRDVVAHHPLREPAVAAALAAEGGPWGWGDRAAVMDALFPDLLPEAVRRRRTKAMFTRVFWGPASRAFARDWDGSGIAHVDADRLRSAWLSERGVGPSATALRAAWLGSLS